jgi:hypothetical protein
VGARELQTGLLQPNFGQSSYFSSNSLIGCWRTGRVIMVARPATTRLHSLCPATPVADAPGQNYHATPLKTVPSSSRLLNYKSRLNSASFCHHTVTFTAPLVYNKCIIRVLLSPPKTSRQANASLYPCPRSPVRSLLRGRVDRLRRRGADHLRRHRWPRHRRWVPYPSNNHLLSLSPALSPRLVVRLCSYEFTSVPFAKPPIGNLRMQPPQEPDSWQVCRTLSTLVCRR